MHIICTRAAFRLGSLAPTSCLWTYHPNWWPYKWVTGVKTLLIGVLTTLITSHNCLGPIFSEFLWYHRPVQKKTGVVLIEQICSWDCRFICEFRSSVESLVGARSGVEDFLTAHVLLKRWTRRYSNLDTKECLLGAFLLLGLQKDPNTCIMYVWIDTYV